MQKYPDDPEAAIFYALALNETALPSDRTYAKQLKAGAILEKILTAQPNHPGALHYLIHSYDYAPLAQRVFASLSQGATAVTTESDVAEAVWRAANDASGQLRFAAGADALALAHSR